MRKTIKFTTATLTALMAASTLSSTVFAADPQKAGSTGDVTVTADDDNNPTDPVIPTDPDTPPTGNKGPLSIDAVTNVHFGTISVKNAGTPMPATNTNPIILQTTDNRGTGDGWVVKVAYGTVSDDHTTSTPTTGKNWVTSDGTVGKGFVLSYPVIDYTTDVADPSNTTPHNQGTAPTGSAVTVSDDAQTIATAAKDAGLSTWIGSFDKTKTTLTVPTTTLKGDYKADLVWTIESAPQA